MAKKETMPWFRLYNEIIDDHKLKVLQFEDRWHYIGILCCKSQGILETENEALRKRMVACKLELTMNKLDDLLIRLAEVGLVNNETLEPLAWDVRQFRSDNSTNRVKKHREKQANQQDAKVKRSCNGHVTPPDTDTDTEKDNKAKPAPQKTVSKPDDIDQQVWQDFLDLRRQKKAKLTLTAWERIRKELDKGKAQGYTPNDMMAEAIASGWQAFKLDWYLNRVQKSQPETKRARTELR